MKELEQLAADVLIRIQKGDTFRRIITLPFIDNVNNYVFSAGVVYGTTTKSMTVSVYNAGLKQIQIFLDAATIAAVPEGACWFFRWTRSGETRTGISGKFAVICKGDE
jgi:hypothetical protein